MPGKQTFRLWASRLVGCPFSITEGYASLNESYISVVHLRYFFSSFAISFSATESAMPTPTMPGTFNVPERSPFSCPPPKIMGVSFTRGLLPGHTSRQSLLGRRSCDRRMRGDRCSFFRHPSGYGRRPERHRYGKSRHDRARSFQSL